MKLLTVRDVMERLGIGRPTAERIMDTITKHRRNQRRLISEAQLQKYLEG